MHEVRRLILTTSEIFTNGPFKIFVSVSLLALDSNRRGTNITCTLKMRIERELVISVEACVFIKNKYRTFKNCLTQNSPIVLVSNKINYLPARLTLKNCKLERYGNIFKNTRLTTTYCSVMRAHAVSTNARVV